MCANTCTVRSDAPSKRTPPGKPNWTPTPVPLRASGAAAAAGYHERAAVLKAAHSASRCRRVQRSRLTPAAAVPTPRQTAHPQLGYGQQTWLPSGQPVHAHPLRRHLQRRRPLLQLAAVLRPQPTHQRAGLWCSRAAAGAGAPRPPGAQRHGMLLPAGAQQKPLRLLTAMERCRHRPQTCGRHLRVFGCKRASVAWLHSHTNLGLNTCCVDSASCCRSWEVAETSHPGRQTFSSDGMTSTNLRHSMVAGCSRKHGCTDSPSCGVSSDEPPLATVSRQTTETASGSQLADTAIVPGSCSALPSCSPAQDNAASTAECGSSSS